MDIQLTDIWTIAAILIGFQITSFAWRVDREVKMGEKNDITWLPQQPTANGDIFHFKKK
jgi:hypothetical protein